jgi:hypothetical protein
MYVYEGESFSGAHMAKRALCGAGCLVISACIWSSCQDAWPTVTACMCVCTYAYKWVYERCMYACIYIYVYLYTCVHLHAHVHTSVYSTGTTDLLRVPDACVCVCVSVHMGCVYIYMCVCVCTYICIIHTYKHIYIHTHIQPMPWIYFEVPISGVKNGPTVVYTSDSVLMSLMFLRTSFLPRFIADGSSLRSSDLRSSPSVLYARTLTWAPPQTCAYACLNVYMCACVCMCMHACIHTYVHMHLYICLEKNKARTNTACVGVLGARCYLSLLSPVRKLAGCRHKRCLTPPAQSTHIATHPACKPQVHVVRILGVNSLASRRVSAFSKQMPGTHSWSAGHTFASQHPLAWAMMVSALSRRTRCAQSRVFIILRSNLRSLNKLLLGALIKRAATCTVLPTLPFLSRT